MTVLVPWCIEDAHFTVKVEIPGVTSGTVVDIYGSDGDRIPTLDWESCGFDDFKLGLCVARALNEAESSHDCRCGDRCRC